MSSALLVSQKRYERITFERESFFPYHQFYDSSALLVSKKRVLKENIVHVSLSSVVVVVAAAVVVGFCRVAFVTNFQI